MGEGNANKADEILEFSDKKLISVVRNGVHNKYVLDVDESEITSRIRSALRILAYDILEQDKHLLTTETREELNEEAGFEMLIDIQHYKGGNEWIKL